MNAVGRLFIRAHTTLLRLTNGRRFNMGGNVLILNTVGAKSGKPRANPLMYLPLARGRYAVFASAAGSDASPGWYHNVVAQPDVAVEIDGHRMPMRARVAVEPERSELYGKIEARQPRFAEYKTKTTRTIPVVVLEPR